MYMCTICRRLVIAIRGALGVIPKQCFHCWSSALCHWICAKDVENQTALQAHTLTHTLTHTHTHTHTHACVHAQEERQQRLGPGGLDPVEVMETLPEVTVDHLYYKYTIVYHSIPQYTTVYHSILQYTTVYYSIPQYTTVYHSVLQ